MKEGLFVAALLLGFAVFAFAHEDRQDRPALAVLPFTGGLGAEGDAVAALLSESPEVLGAFAVVSPTGEASAAVSEHRFRAGAFTDSDAIAYIGRMLGADYVISGHMRRLGNRNLIIAAVTCVATLELVAGYYRTYRSFWEIRSFMPSMSGRLVGPVAERRRTEAAGGLALRPALAVAPFSMIRDLEGETAGDPTGEMDAHDFETLVQILAIELAATGVYAVLPRPAVMRAALREWEAGIVEDMGATLEMLVELLLGLREAEEGEAVGEEYFVGAVTAIGRAADAELILSIETRGLGYATMFAAQILRSEDGNPLAGASRSHGGVGDGVSLMAEIAVLLTDAQGAPERLAGLARQRRLAVFFGDPARFWSVGASVGTSFAAPWAIATLHATVAPFPFSFFRFGCDFGFLSGVDAVDYFSLYPFAHGVFFLPFSWGGWYIGAGGGFLLARYAFYGLAETRSGFLADFTTGFSIANMFDVSYTLRTDFSTVNGKVSVGFTHRFRHGGR